MTTKPIARDWLNQRAKTFFNLGRLAATMQMSGTTPGLAMKRSESIIAVESAAGPA